MSETTPSIDPGRIDPGALRELVPLSGLRPEIIEALMPHVRARALAAGETFEPGDPPADTMVYVVAGEIEVLVDGAAVETIEGGTDAARHAVARLSAGGAAARARTDASLVVIERPVVSNFLIWAEYSSTWTGSAHEEAARTGEWTQTVLRSELLSQIPPANVERIFSHLEPVSVKAGEPIVRQGDPGNFYYVIQRGRCEVSHRAAPDAEPITLAVLEAGESFGEEALLTDAERNASVTMLSDGVLLRMTKEDFVELIHDPLLTYVGRDDAEGVVERGGAWLDVRLPEEHVRDRIDGSLNIPLSRLRDDVEDLDREIVYVVYCNSGRRSAAAAFLMSERGFDTRVLEGGLLGGGAARAPAPAPEPDLHLQLARANAELEEALLQKAEIDAERELTDDDTLRETEEARARVEQRKAGLDQESERASAALAGAKTRKLELEEKIRAAEARAASERARAEASVETLRKRAEARLRAERDRLRSEYAQAAKRIEELKRAREAAEAEFLAQRRKLEQELDEKRRSMESEAKRIREEMDARKRDAESKVEAIRASQRSEEQRLREETESKLRAERRRLEAEFALSVAAQEKARHDLELATVARKAAQHEAERLAAELASAVERRRAEEQERVQAERTALEQASAQAKEQLDAATRARAEAEEKTRDLESTIVRFSKTEASGDREAKLREELEGFEVQLATATERLEEAKSAAETAERRQREAEARIARQREVEEELRLQLAQEMESWLEDERERSDAEVEEMRRKAEQLERIQREKDAARERERDAASSMMDDIAAQLAGTDEDDEDWGAETIRLQRYAEERAALTREAMDDINERKRKAETALRSARERIERLRSEHGEG